MGGDGQAVQVDATAVIEGLQEQIAENAKTIAIWRARALAAESLATERTVSVKRGSERS